MINLKSVYIGYSSRHNICSDFIIRRAARPPISVSYGVKNLGLISDMISWEVLRHVFGQRHMFYNYTNYKLQGF